MFESLTKGGLSSISSFLMAIGAFALYNDFAKQEYYNWGSYVPILLGGGRDFGREVLKKKFAGGTTDAKENGKAVEGRSKEEGSQG